MSPVFRAVFLSNIAPGAGEFGFLALDVVQAVFQQSRAMVVSFWSQVRKLERKP
jgi:hypothetical protein